MPLKIFIVAALMTSACIFDPNGSLPSGGADADATPTEDADVDDLRPDADGRDSDLPPECEIGETRCRGEVLDECLDGRWVALTDCLLGCDDEAGRCRAIVPSNVGPGLLDAGTSELSTGTELLINTDSGEITSEGDPIRAAGVGLERGIYFQIVETECRGLGVFALQSLYVGQTGRVRIVGERALVLLASDNVEIAGRVLASAKGVLPGPGGFVGGIGASSGAGPGGGSPGTSIGTAFDGGGGGGGHGASGGTGGAASTALGGEPGPTNGDATLVPLCGGSGGGGEINPNYSAGGSTGGGGGGALQITAAREIVIQTTAILRVDGGGGSGGDLSGGAGGGAGGAILLEAPTVEVLGEISAVGGGGGAGASSPAGADGGDGDDGGRGATGNSTGGGGGDGGSGESWEGGLGVSHSNNGGGGGGFAGRIRINVLHEDMDIGGTISPSPPSLGTILTN